MAAATSTTTSSIFPVRIIMRPSGRDWSYPADVPPPFPAGAGEGAGAGTAINGGAWTISVYLSGGAGDGLGAGTGVGAGAGAGALFPPAAQALAPRSDKTSSMPIINLFILTSRF